MLTRWRQVLISHMLCSFQPHSPPRILFKFHTNVEKDGWKADCEWICFCMLGTLEDSDHLLRLRYFVMRLALSLRQTRIKQNKIWRFNTELVVFILLELSLRSRLKMNCLDRRNPHLVKVKPQLFFPRYNIKREMTSSVWKPRISLQLK